MIERTTQDSTTDQQATTTPILVDVHMGYNESDQVSTNVPDDCEKVKSQPTNTESGNT